MKQYFIQKNYDVLIGEGKGGGDAYTVVLSKKQKHHLAMMDDPTKVRSEIQNIKNQSHEDVHYVQCEHDIKDYLRWKLRFWKIITIILFLITALAAVLPVFVINEQPILSESQAWVICLLSGFIMYISYKQGMVYRKQCEVMSTL